MSCSLDIMWLPGLLVFFLLATACRGEAKDSGLAEVELTLKNVSKLSFGSCSRQHLPQPLWQYVQAQAPDLFLWLGDAVYIDRRIAPLVWRPSTIPAMKEQYALQLRHPNYSQFLSSGIPVLGIWDDHDYGMNDGGIDYADAEQSKELFFEFIAEPKNSIRRRRHGMFGSYLLSSTNGKKIKLILTDVRSLLNRTSGDVLGADQWRWLEEQLSAGEKEADITVVTSGMQVISDLPVIDRMQRYGNSRKRYLELLGQFPRVILLSGDVHYAEVNCIQPRDSSGYAVHELTSSGMTHTCLGFNNDIMNALCHLSLDLVLQSSYRVTQQVMQRNFAVLQFDWSNDQGSVTFNVHSMEGVQLTYHLDLEQLASRSSGCPATVTQPPPVFVFWLCIGSCILLFAMAMLLSFRAMLICLYALVRYVLASVAAHNPGKGIKNE